MARNRTLLVAVVVLGLVALALFSLELNKDSPTLIDAGNQASDDASAILERAEISEPAEQTTEVAPLVEERTPVAVTRSTHAELSRLKIHVHDSEGVPIQDARIRSRSEEGYSYLGMTNAEGIVQALVAMDTHELVADASGFQRGTKLLSRSRTGAPESPVLIELSVGVELNGLVRWIDGVPASPGVRVLAWRSGYYPESKNVRAAASGEDRDDCWVTLTDARGEFRFSGLAANRNYTVTAAGDGGLCDRRVPVNPSDELLQLTLVPGFAAVMKLVGPDGLRPRTSPLVWGRGIAFSFDEDPDAFRISGGALELHLLLVPEQFIDTLHRDKILHVLGRKSRAPSAGPIRVSGLVPGYDEFSMDLPALPIDEEIPEYEIVLNQTATEWGAVEIRCFGVSQKLSTRSDGERKVGRIELTNLTTRQVSTISATEAMWRTAQRIDGVPVGSYEVRLTMGDWANVIPPYSANPMIVDVLPAPAVWKLTLSVGNSATVMFVAPANDGTEYTGNLILVLSKEGRTKGSRYESFISFANAPYILPVIPQGAYGAKVEHSEGQWFPDAPMVEFTVKPGDLCIVSLKLDD